MESTRLFDQRVYHDIVRVNRFTDNLLIPPQAGPYSPTGWNGRPLIVPEQGYTIHVLNLSFSMEILCLNQGTQYLIYPFQWKSGV